MFMLYSVPFLIRGALIPLIPNALGTTCRALADKSRADLVAAEVAVVEEEVTPVVAVVDPMVARAVMVVVEVTSRVVEEVTVDRAVTVVAEDTSRVVEEVTAVADTDRLSTIAPQHWLLQHAGCGSIALLDCYV